MHSIGFLHLDVQCNNQRVGSCSALLCLCPLLVRMNNVHDVIREKCKGVLPTIENDPVDNSSLVSLVHACKMSSCTKGDLCFFDCYVLACGLHDYL